MPRSLAGRLLVFAAGLALAAAQATADPVNQINGIGLIDYNHPPTFKVGDYVRYRMTGKATSGLRDAYTVTVLIAGEEEFWGERGFWVETWTDFDDKPPEAVASFMSYAIFDDDLPADRVEYYQRKTVNEIAPNGRPVQLVMTLPTEALTSRTLSDNPKKVVRDTIGPDTVHTPAGDFKTLHVKFRFGRGITQAQGDSTSYEELRENRDVHYSQEIPVTHLAREDIETSLERRTWMVGRSQEGAPLRMVEKGVGSARLLEYGSGMKPRLLPISFYKSLGGKPSVAAKPSPGTPNRR